MTTGSAEPVRPPLAERLVAGPLQFGRDWVVRFVELQGFDRGGRTRRSGVHSAHSAADRLQRRGLEGDRSRRLLGGVDAANGRELGRAVRRIGAAFALLSWLVGAGMVLVMAASGGAVIEARLHGRRRPPA